MPKKKAPAKKKKTVKKKAAAVVMKKPTKAAEEAAFRAEVQNYLKTGQSSLLTPAEKASLDKTRQQDGWLNRVLHFFSGE